MSGDSNLATTLVDRLTTWLPHRTGAHSFDHSRDEAVTLTRTTLVNISTSSIGIVVGSVVQLLEDLAKPHKAISTHPVHVFCSELYVLELLAECCSAHWESVYTPNGSTASDRGSATGSEYLDDFKNGSQSPRSRKIRASRDRRNSRDLPLEPLEDEQVRRILEILKLFSNPIPENFVLPAQNILDDVVDVEPHRDELPRPQTNGSNVQQNPTDTGTLLREHSETIEGCIRNITEFISCSNWPRVAENVTNALRGLRISPAAGNAASVSLVADDDRSALISIRLISYFWIDSRKLSQMIQELCGSFLHLRKAFQTTVAIIVPLLITRWLERNPVEFTELHTMRKRLDGGADTLFDMTNSMIDGSKRKGLLYPFQVSLIFLLPDVFEVASHMREVKSTSIAKKVSFLETLRKNLRNRNEAAIYCLISLLRVARHFRLNSDAALLSFALDVQEEVREAVFRRSPPGGDNVLINSHLLTAAIVSTASLNFETIVDNLAPLCLAMNAPQDFQIAIVSASTHFARQTNTNDYHALFLKVADFVRRALTANLPSTREPYADSQLSIKPSTDILQEIFSFLDAAPLTLFLGVRDNNAQMSRDSQDLTTSFLAYVTSDDDKVRLMSQRVCRKFMEEGSLVIARQAIAGGMPASIARDNFWRLTSDLLIRVCSNLGENNDTDMMTLHFMRDYTQSRLKVLRSITELAELDEDIPEFVAAIIKIEMSYLISLCSTDVSVCQMVTSCISVISDEAQLLSTIADSRKLSLSTLRNLDVYQQLASKDFRFTGLVAFQKRARGLLRQMQCATVGILASWEAIFDKWLQLSQELLHSVDDPDDKSIAEWRNYSGFLASLGGICLSQSAIHADDSGLSTMRWIDGLSPDNQDGSLLSRYLRQSVQLLASANARIREATRDILASETSKALLIPLLETLGSELEFLFNNPAMTAALTAGEPKIAFCEQAAALLKSIMDRLGGPTEIGSGLSVDIGALTLDFAKFLNKSVDGASILRVKIKACQLCETVTRKKELLNLRHDVRVRHQLLEVLFGWIARPSSPMVDNAMLMSGARMEEITRLQRDLDKSCLRALADLTSRLPLQPAEGQTDADTSDLKSEMFRTYFNRFLSLLNHETADVGRTDSRLTSAVSDESTPTTELAITALSNLLSANIDVGLKHSLSIGYHEDLDIRTAFVKVLCNILIQGTEFNNLSDAAVNRKYDELLELLINDLALTIALCDACPSSEVDEMTISLLNIFDSRGLGFVLLEALMEHEVDETENEAELLRRNCVATKILSVYAKWKGAAYLKATLQKVLERLISSSEDLDLELDPTRTTSKEELQKNALQLRVVTKVFIDDICNSAGDIPVSFRRICSIISSTVMRRFPEAKFTAVGAFIFLRFFCPAIVAPDAEGLITTTPSKEMRRGLLLIAKVVQNLANNVLFGAKEPYMFPLNDFLTQNIYRVTTFLREISVPPNVAEPIAETESFEFGSCVALHRFLYDNWDHVRQKLLLKERKGSSLSPLDITKGQLPILEALRKLISNLGPPPMDVSWNRPAISQNTPTAYSRFQHFMLGNAGRSTESIVSSRAVYDGGESNDGMSMICVILRSIDPETVDYDLLLFVFLKIASRMWHKPFGIIVDATCYSGQNEPQDTLFRKLDSLTPTELSKNLSRFYVYNMNSAFRKCFRRMLRLSSKSENSAFHPRNIDYHLLGNLQDLQAHFHLSQLHLPKETISVVTDTRYLFQPITRLSKTKGKVEVIIKIGPQFLQVTTSKKQEVVQGLRLHGTVNDIFRLSEVDEAPTSIQTEDDSAFGLRTENGRIVMYFTSPKKADILRAVRSAKATYSKELKTLKSFERLVRPQDVPGTLLNIAFTNMASTDQTLRHASYNLLCALCRAFKFASDSRFVSTRELCVPLNPSTFIVDISQQLARSEPQLTGDFLNEFFVGWDRFPYQQRPLSLAYMAPWLPSLRTNLIPNDTDSDKAREKVAAIFRKLIEVAISDLALSTTLEHIVWPVICKDELYVDIFLEDVVKTALTFGIDDERTELIGSTIASIGTITIRGKLLARLRKSLNRTSLRPTRYLPENTVWTELCVILRLYLCTSFDSAAQSQLYVPEIFHLVTMLANTGSNEVKVMVHRLLINTIHAICTTFQLEENNLARLTVLLASISEPKSDSLFTSNSSLPPLPDSSIAVAIENLASLLSEITIIAAPTIDLSNAWRSRWMSLVASTAFQSNPAIQPRAFTVMGCLAREDVDDDLLYQVLVALRHSVSRFMEDNDSEMLIAIVSSLTKMMDKLPSGSRYGLQLFWLALSLVRLVPINLFNCTALFLDAVLNNINASGDFSGGRIVHSLLQGRLLLEEAALQLDEIYGINFNIENFHYAIAATLVKGLTESVTKTTAIRVLSTFLTTVTANSSPRPNPTTDATCLPYLGLLMSLALTAEEAKDVLWLAGVTNSPDENVSVDEAMRFIEVDTVKDKELLLVAAIGVVDFHYLEDTVQNRKLRWLNKMATQRPTVVLHLSGPLMAILDEVIMTSQSATTLEAAHLLLRTFTSNPKIAGPLDTTEMLEEVLEGVGFAGLWRSSSFHVANVQERQCTALTDKLIELIIA